MLTAEERQQFKHLCDDIEQISAAASHDLRDHLREALSHCATLRENVGYEAFPLIGQIESCIRNTMEHVAALRQYAYLAQNLESPRPVALEDILAAAREHFTPQLVARRGAIWWDTALHAPLSGRAAQLEQLFIQLFDNGLKYNPSPQPEIRVSIHNTGHFYECVVADNGSGMEPEFARLVFGLFKRIEPEGAVKGCGAGLSIVKKVAENHGGAVTLESEPGYGCRVIVTLPHVSGGVYIDTSSTARQDSGG